MKYQNFKSDFTSVHTFCRQEGDEKKQIAVPEHVRLTFFTAERCGCITIERNGVNMTSCSLSEDGMTLNARVPLSKKSLGTGELFCEISEITTDAEFPDKERIEVTPIRLGVTLWPGKSDDSLEVSADIVLGVVCPGAVRYDTTQNLADAQKAQACANIGALRTIPEASVSTRKIANAAVIEKKIADGAVTKQKLAADIAGIVDSVAKGTADYSLQQNSCQAISRNSIATGNGTIAGTKGVRWTAIDFTTKTITLEKALTASIGAGALLSIINDNHYDKCSEVAETAAIGATTIKVKSLPFTSIAEDTGDDAKTIMVYSNPNVGDVDLGDGAHSEGVNTKATQRGSHAEGRDTYAAGQYSHAEGRSTEAFYASHAEGRDSKAIGLISHAEGNATTASGNNSHAEGKDTIAMAGNSHAEGWKSKTSQDALHSHAEGNNTTANGVASHAEGNNTTANGVASHAEGSNCTANKDKSHAEGASTIADGESSHAEGRLSVAVGNYSHAEGNNTKSKGIASHAEGDSTIAEMNTCHAEGYKTYAKYYRTHSEGKITVAIGEGSHSEGISLDNIADTDEYKPKSIVDMLDTYYAAEIAKHSEFKSFGAVINNNNNHKFYKWCKDVIKDKWDEYVRIIQDGGTGTAPEGLVSMAIGYASHVEGRDTAANGTGAHAEGYRTFADADAAHVEGICSFAPGRAAHAEGTRTTAAGANSHAEGYHTLTKNSAEHAQGMYNNSNKGSNTLGDALNTIFSVGVGKKGDRKNAFEMMQNGDAYLLGVGGYDGKNPAASKAVQQVIGALLDIFKPVQVNDNKSGATDATQLAELKAYAAKLAAYGVDTTNGYEIPILYNSGSKGFIGYNPNAASSFNCYAVTPEGNFYTLTMNATTGALSKKILATTTVTDALSTNKQPKTDAALKTTSKTITGAINEVNDKTAYVAFTDVTKLSTNLGKRLIYKGGNVTLSSPITINSNIYEIDFNGATITIGALARTGITAIKGHSHCIIKNLVIEGIWTTNADAVSNVLETFAGVENVNIDVHFSGSKYGRGFFNCQRLINCKAEITSNHSEAQTRGFSYCEYLYMCRIGEGSVGEGFFHCTNMISCDALAVVNASGTGITMGCFRKELVECSNYTNFRRRTNEYISDKEVTYGFFSDTDSLSVNGYSLTPFANTIAAKNEDDTKALVHPAGGTGVAEVPLNTEASGNSIARRLPDGRLRAAAATAPDDVVIMSQLNALALQVSALRQTVSALQTEVNALEG